MLPDEASVENAALKIQKLLENRKRKRKVTKKMYKEVIIGWFKHFDFLLLDAGLLEVSLIIAYWLRHGFGGVPHFIKMPCGLFW